jgi:hypothetical protein
VLGKPLVGGILAGENLCLGDQILVDTIGFPTLEDRILIVS